MSRKSTKAKHMLKKVMELIGGEYWESRRGTPVLTIASYNISYFCNTRSFKFFIHNTQDTFVKKTYIDVINFLKGEHNVQDRK